MNSRKPIPSGLVHGCLAVFLSVLILLTYYLLSRPNYSTANNYLLNEAAFNSANGLLAEHTKDLDFDNAYLKRLHACGYIAPRHAYVKSEYLIADKGQRTISIVDVETVKNIEATTKNIQLFFSQNPKILNFDTQAGVKPVAQADLNHFYRKLALLTKLQQVHVDEIRPYHVYASLGNTLFIIEAIYALLSIEKPIQPLTKMYNGKRPKDVYIELHNAIGEVGKIRKLTQDPSFKIFGHHCLKSGHIYPGDVLELAHILEGDVLVLLQMLTDDIRFSRGISDVDQSSLTITPSHVHRRATYLVALLRELNREIEVL